MVKSLKTLRMEKKKLLEKSNARKTLMANKERDRSERRKLEAEIKALKNPSSVRAQKVAKTLAARTGRLLLKGTRAFGKHVVQLGREQQEEDRKSKSRRKRK